MGSKYFRNSIWRFLGGAGGGEVSTPSIFCWRKMGRATTSSSSSLLHDKVDFKSCAACTLFDFWSVSISDCSLYCAVFGNNWFLGAIFIVFIFESCVGVCWWRSQTLKLDLWVLLCDNFFSPSSCHQSKLSKEHSSCRESTAEHVLFEPSHCKKWSILIWIALESFVVCRVISQGVIKTAPPPLNKKYIHEAPTQRDYSLLTTFSLFTHDFLNAGNF